MWLCREMSLFFKKTLLRYVGIKGFISTYPEITYSEMILKITTCTYAYMCVYIYMYTHTYTTYTHTHAERIRQV